MTRSLTDRSLSTVAGEADTPKGLTRHLVHRALSKLSRGELHIVERGARLSFGVPTPDALCSTIRVRDPAMYGSVAVGGSVAAGESYMRGEWDCDDLTSLCRLVVRNRHVFNAVDGRLTWPLKLARSISHWFSRNTRSGSRANIAAHYDLSNEFFALWLDSSMMYSCALYKRPDGSPIPSADLEAAQLARLDLIVDRLGLAPGDHLLEIGTGWGAMASHAARQSGCTVTTTTISTQQAHGARQRALSLGVGDRVRVLEQDYRDLMGSYDKVVSLEMVEAVGHQFLDAYFQKCARLLRSGGSFVMQAIVIDDRYYEEGLHYVDFIKKHVFPGSFIPSREVLTKSAAAAGFTVERSDEIGPHYATTLAQWRQRFFSALPAVRRLGFDDSFIRMWEFYLCYCEAGFAEGHLGDIVYQFRKG